MLGLLATLRARPKPARLARPAPAFLRIRQPATSLQHNGNSPVGYNGAPHICLRQHYPFPMTDPQTPLPASSMDAAAASASVQAFSTLGLKGKGKVVYSSSRKRLTSTDPLDRQTRRQTDQQMVRGNVL